MDFPEDHFDIQCNVSVDTLILIFRHIEICERIFYLRVQNQRLKRRSIESKRRTLRITADLSYIESMLISERTNLTRNIWTVFR